MVQESRALIDPKTGELVARPPSSEPQPLAISPFYIEQQKRSLILLQALVRDVLVKGRDYGHVPGIPAEFLWDPGASQIIGSFNSHVGPRRILSLVDDGEKIAVIVEVPLLAFGSDHEVGSGIGAASTYETKHKYRWVNNPREWGYTEEASKTLKSRERDGDIEFRIPNPEHGELLNTIVKMASKRAEVDAAEGLPGVASALRGLFDPKAPKRREPDWPAFWAKIAQMGLPEATVHEVLKVTSLNDWLKQGRTLDEAISVLAEHQAKTASPSPPPPGPQAPATPGPAPASGAEQVQPGEVEELNDLFRLCNKFWKLQPAAVVKELGYRVQLDIKETPWDCFEKIRAARA